MCNELDCKFTYHIKCIDEWLETNVQCPRCRHCANERLDTPLIDPSTNHYNDIETGG